MDACSAVGFQVRMLTLQMPKSNCALTSKISQSNKAPGLSQASQAAGPGTTLLTQMRNERMGAMEAAGAQARPCGSRNPPFLCRSIPIFSHSPFCLLSLQFPLSSHSGLLQVPSHVSKAPWLLHIRILSGSLCSSLILSVILQKKLRWLSFLFSYQLGIRAPWLV